MTHQTDLFNKVEKKIDDIKIRLESYKKVDATLSKYTLLETLENLLKADETLENGFVKDSCDDVENKVLKY